MIFFLISIFIRFRVVDRICQMFCLANRNKETLIYSYDNHLKNFNEGLSLVLVTPSIADNIFKSSTTFPPAK